MVGQAETTEGEFESARSYYARELALGVERYLLEPVSTCPWCGHGALRHRTTCRDLRQFKPGTFRLDECVNCGHVFQNPAVNDEGLTFYYRDNYDGINAETAEGKFGAGEVFYLGRAGTVAHGRPDQPPRWLDVGTAHAHFCEAAAKIFPNTLFDGLDMSDGVLAGHRAGRIQTAYQGQFPELSAQLAGSYDQVSMFHYLEHTRDPFGDLDAAAQVLTDDGWLLIEQPDPESPAARLFGSWWPGWNQPEHLNMVTRKNLCAALEDRGFEIVEVVQKDAHIPMEAFIVVITILNKLAPAGEIPWKSGRPPRYLSLRRAIGKVVAAPFLLLTLLIDRFVLPRMLHSFHAYRVLARKVPASTGGTRGV